MRTDEEIYQEKAEFVKEKLLPLLQTIDRSLQNTEYFIITHGNLEIEYIQLDWDNDKHQRIYVTGDSLLALAKDVLWHYGKVI